MKIVLINGKKRHGKDYLALELKKELQSLGATVEIMSFAEPIKDIISITTGVTLENLERYKNNSDSFLIRTEDTCTNYREILQRFGTEAMKKWFNDDVWVELALTRAEASTSDIILIPDFRFPVEVISEFTISIFNNDIISTDTHISENALNDFNFWYKVDNTGKKDISKDVKKLAKALYS